MTRWHDLLPTDDDFLTSAPVRTRRVLHVDRPVEELWAALEADDAVAAWSPVVTRSRWPRPHGLGSCREVTLGGLLTVSEVFRRWDDNERMTFSADRTTGHGIRRFAEDYVVSPTPVGSRLVWTVALETTATLPAPVARSISGLLGAAVGQLSRGLGSSLR